MWLLTSKSQVRALPVPPAFQCHSVHISQHLCAGPCSKIEVKKTQVKVQRYGRTAPPTWVDHARRIANPETPLAKKLLHDNVASRFAVGDARREAYQDEFPQPSTKRRRFS